MIGSTRFQDDNNNTLMLIQYELYWTLLPFLYQHTKSRYLHAARYIGVSTELSKRILHIEKFDHRVLQDAHDKVAAYFRYQFPDKLGQIIIPAAIPDCVNLTPEEAVKEFLKREWCKFWYEEVRDLSMEPTIARATLTAIAYQNTEEGYEAEGLLLELLHDRYGKDWDYRAESARDVKRNKRENNMYVPRVPDFYER